MRFFLPLRKQENKNNEQIVWERQVILGESVYLPIYFGVNYRKEYILENAEYSKEDVQKILSRKFVLFCSELEKKGVQIIEKNVKIHIDENQAAATGSLSLVEPLIKSADIELERNYINGTVRNNH